MAPLSGEWLEALKGEFHQPYYAKLYKTVMQEYHCLLYTSDAADEL